MSGKKVVFLDLQGTLGGEGLGDIVDFSFFPFSVDALRLLNQHGLPVIIITNQSHISKGYFTYQDYESKVVELCEQLKAQGVYFDAIYCCPHSEKDNCSCAKPLPGMILQAQKDFDIDISQSYVVGDMGMSDMVLAKNIGAKGILVKTGVGEGSLTTFRYTWEGIEPYYVADNVLDVVKYIIGK